MHSLKHIALRVLGQIPGERADRASDDPQAFHERYPTPAPARTQNSAPGAGLRDLVFASSG
ncbi:MAG: hypothetical protein ACRDPA_20095 [Solirubrobacteraceae bacterium]